jgi:hypothetical protein
LIRYGVLLASVLGLVTAETVTLDVGTYRNANRVLVFVFSGTISNRAAGEYVEVVGRYCWASGDRLIAGATTSGGGGWRVENPSSEPPYPPSTPVHSGTTLRARWNGQYSEPVTWRVPARPWVARISGTRTWVVHATPGSPTGQPSLQGKRVELQRLTAGGWVRIRSARLVRKASLKWGPFNYQASFTVPTRGLRLRAYLPVQSAAPCYLPGGSESWRS